jgi:hypothetical protein
MEGLVVKARLVSGDGWLINVGSETSTVMYSTGRAEWSDWDWEACTLPPFTHWKLEEVSEDEYDKFYA